MLSDLRHSASLSPDTTPSVETDSEAPLVASNRFQYTLAIPTKESAKPRAQTAAIHTYNYLSKDLLKTALVTGSIVIVELVLAHVTKAI